MNTGLLGYFAIDSFLKTSLIPTHFAPTTTPLFIRNFMKPILNNLIFRCVPVLATLLLCAQASFAQMGKIDTSFVSDDSFFVLRVDVKKLVDQVPMGSKDLEMIAEVMKEEGGFDLMNMTALTMQFGKLDGGPFDSAFSVTFEHSKKIDRDALFTKGAFEHQEYTEAEFAGKTYLRTRGDGGPHVYFSNDKTFTMATLKGMESLLEAGSGMGTMSSYLKSAPPGSEIMMAYKSAEGSKTMLDQIFRSMGPIGLPFEPQDLLAGVKTGVGNIQLSSSTPIFIKANCDSNDSASEMKSAMDDLVVMGNGALPFGQKMVDAQMKELGDDEFSAMQKSMLTLANDGLKTGKKVLDGAETKVEGKVVTFRVKQMGGLKELVPLAVGGMKAMFLGSDGSSRMEVPDRAIDRVEKKAVRGDDGKE